ncbi:PREDICTED: uncharacterized protein LOC109162016 [Ipomoea nil]|uniref:uncharacterized protein LOC109162016 n=1 Tax=Ipomoea nil TaxID=35883 RepID=UPI000900A0B7|nr:PREDICTED: uncharacterized protein LOC109162016 [Ipomoea nil]
MERLISFNPISSKPALPPRLSPLGFATAARPKLAFSPPLTSADSPRFHSIRCRYLDSSSVVASEFRDALSDKASEPADLPDGNALQPNFIQQIAEHVFNRQKAVGAIILLSAICTLFHPAIVSPAFASFQSAAKAGGSAASAAGISSELLNSAWTGFFAGCLHTLSGPDHLAALAPLSIGRTRMESAAVGALWGCGHDAGQVIFGLLFLLLKDRLHIEVIRTWGTRVVGFTLLVIGAMGIKEASEVHAPCVALENGECDVSLYDGLEAPPAIGKKKKVGLATFATGIVHGLQPDALLIILPALALPSRLAGAAFLGMFLVGTVIAMGSYTAFIGSFSQALKDRVPRITEKLTWAASLLAIGLGLSLLVSQFFGFSLY